MIISIDPGSNGAISTIDWNNIINVYKMPSTEVEIIDLIKTIINANKEIHMCYLEKIHSMPQQGVVSTFTFGLGYGFLRGVIQTLNITLVDVSPQKWMKSIGVPIKLEKKDRKDWIYQYVRQTYPDVKIHKYAADSIGILHYAIKARNKI